MTKINIQFNPEMMTVRDVKNITSTMRDLVRVAKETEEKCAEVDGDYMYNKLMEDFFWKFINSTSNLESK